MLRPCAGCRQLIPASSGPRCARCKRDPSASWSGRDNAAHKRFARQVRARARRDRGREECERCGSTDRLRAAHVVPVAAGGTNELDNGELRCHGCDTRLDPHAR